jgi:hypothetical protein
MVLVQSVLVDLDDDRNRSSGINFKDLDEDSCHQHSSEDVFNSVEQEMMGKKHVCLVT